MYNNIPVELQNLKQWVVWRYEETEGGKPTKLPYCPMTNKLASTTDPSTWGTFLQAVQASFNGYIPGSCSRATTLIAVLT